MPQPRTCPHCTVDIPLRKGYKFDEHDNMICVCCGGIAFPANKEAEDELKDKKRKGTTTTNSYWENHHRKWYGQGGYGQGSYNSGANKTHAPGNHAAVGFSDY